MGWLPYIGLLALIVFLVCLLDPCRAYEVVLESRPVVTDEQLFNTYFLTEGMEPDVPGRVRRVVSQIMECPAEKMLPDDDLSFFWNEVDGIELVRALDREFGIEITKEAVARIVKACNLRAFSQLVQRTMRAVEAA